MIRYGRAAAVILVAVLGMGGVSASRAAEYRLVVQTALTPAETRTAFKPLAEYLSRATGDTIRLDTALNFLSHWEQMRRSRDYDFILDAAHFTDFRVKRLGYEVLAKVPGVLSFSIVTGPNTLILDPEELRGKRVASLASPALGAVRLVELFPDPIRTPVIIEVNNTQAAVDKVLSGKAMAAVIPSPLVQNYPELNVVATTEQIPGVALSASTRVPAETREAVRRALLEADEDPAGRSALDAANLGSFEPASAALYDGYDKLLRGTWGY